MLRLQLDDRALFLARWRDLLLAVLDPEAIIAGPRRQELARLVEHWGGRAAIGSVGYRLVRAFRREVARRVFKPLTAPVTAARPGFDYGLIRYREVPLWALVQQRPARLLDPAYADWRGLLLAAADAVTAEDGWSERTWGERNRVRVQHPFSRLLPLLGRWLDMPETVLPGDRYMPRVQGRGVGASQRLVVSPGRERQGIFHMPGGQSGHPLSPYYGAGHQDWVEGRPSAFLPGETVWRLTLVPGAQR